MVLYLAMKENVINMKRTIHEYEVQIQILKEELSKENGQNWNQVTRIDNFDGLKERALAIKEDLH